MPRDTARKIEKDPGGVGAVCQRDSTGTVQSQDADTTTVTGFSNTTGTTITSMTATGLFAFDGAEVRTTGATGNMTTATFTVSRNGSSIGTGTWGGTGSTTATVSLTTHTTPLNAPTYTLSGSLNTGGSVDLTFAPQRANRWV